MHKYHKFLPVITGLLLLAAGLGCSVGTLLVRAPLPSATPTKTPRPIFTATLIPTETPTFTPVPTETPIPTETPTSPPTDTPAPVEEAPTEAPPTNTPVPQDPPTPAPPPPPTDTPAPTDTPVPSFPFLPALVTHPIEGNVSEFRISGLAWKHDQGTLPGYQMQVTTPSGAQGTSDISGSGMSDSTPRGTGTHHVMNFEFKHSPYEPGVYKVILVKDGQQVSSEVEVTAGGGPYTYAHIDFVTQ